MPDPEFLVEGVLEVGGSALFVGESGVGKSFVVEGMGFAVASGGAWLGRKVRQGPVVYVAGEGGGGLAKRIRALVEHSGRQSPPEDFYFFTQAVNLFDEASVREAIRATEERCPKPALVVFDTLARSMVGATENSAKDVGKVVDAIDDLRTRLGCAVIVIHHLDKKGKTERGSGSLLAAVDAEFLLKKTGTDRRLENTKQRNFAEAEPIRISLVQVAESLVAVEASTSVADWTKAARQEDKTDEKDEAIRQAIVDALNKAGAKEGNPVNQTALLRGVSGNSKRKAELLHEMAADESSPVEQVSKGNSKLYYLRQ